VGGRTLAVFATHCLPPESEMPCIFVQFSSEVDSTYLSEEMDESNGKLRSQR